MSCYDYIIRWFFMLQSIVEIIITNHLPTLALKCFSRFFFQSYIKSLFVDSNFEKIKNSSSNLNM